MRKFNWQIWAAFLLSLIAFVSYPFFFVKFPVTRDFPWVNLLLFALMAVLLVIGVRKSFASGRAHPMVSKFTGSVLALLSVGVLGLFIFAVFISARDIPRSPSHPQVGSKAPDFTLTDTNGNPVPLSELLTSPVKGKATKGVLLVFYRGYW